MNIQHAEVVDWATAKWENLTGEKFRDPDRSIRLLYSEGLLVKIGKGIYKYDPDAVREREQENFTEAQKAEILERGGYVCAICGLGEKDGIELHVDHIKPKQRGGKATIDNGQVLCGKHNYRKKAYDQTESGKRMFINLYKQSTASGDKELAEFCKTVLNVYEEHDINGHVEWKR